MRAAFLAGAETIEIRDVADPGPDLGLVVVDVVACGVCGSDLHGWRHPEQAVAAGGAVLPGIGGHEVVATDHQGAGFVIEPNLAGSCGVCEACAAGRAWFCRNRRVLPSWGFAEKMYVREQSLFAVPDAVPIEVASLTEPLACAVHALRASHSGAGRKGTVDQLRVAVVGAGVAGLLAVAAAERLGASAVASVARYPQQAEAAARLGASEVFESGDPDLRGKLRGFGADLVVEAVGGTAETFTLSTRSVVPGGEVVVLGLFDAAQAVDARRATFRELRLFFPVTYGVAHGRHDFEIALELLEGSPDDFMALVSHRFPLAETGRAFATAADKHSGALRVVVEP